MYSAVMALATCAHSLAVARSAIADIPSEYLQAFTNPSIQTSIGGHAICISGIVNVTASATNVDFNIPPIANQSVLTALITDIMTINSTAVKDLVVGTKTGQWDLRDILRAMFPHCEQWSFQHDRPIPRPRRWIRSILLELCTWLFLCGSCCPTRIHHFLVRSSRHGAL